MHTPFANCDPYDPTQHGKPPRKKKAKVSLRQLVVDFQSEDDVPELGAFRVHINDIQQQIEKLCQEKDEDEGKDINAVGPLIKGSEDYPDKIMMKFEADKVRWEDTAGKELQEADIDFENSDVQPTVHFEDMWKYNGTYWPRLKLVSCIIHRRL